jgi:predicted TPR repeat methyltransferase
MSTAEDDAVQLPDFDAEYARDPDPWRVGTSWYERRKLTVLMSALPAARYKTAWEPGCGPGITSSALATRVDDLVATDGSRVAVEMAKHRCAGLANVKMACSTLPDVPAGQSFELIVAAEFLYYVRNLREALDALWSRAGGGSHVVFMHWAHRPEDAFRSGVEMHAEVAADAAKRGAVRVVSHIDEDFVLDIYQATV